MTEPALAKDADDSVTFKPALTASKLELFITAPDAVISPSCTLIFYWVGSSPITTIGISLSISSVILLLMLFIQQVIK